MPLNRAEPGRRRNDRNDLIAVLYRTSDHGHTNRRRRATTLREQRSRSFPWEISTLFTEINAVGGTGDPLRQVDAPARAPHPERHGSRRALGLTVGLQLEIPQQRALAFLGHTAS